MTTPFLDPVSKPKNIINYKMKKQHFNLKKPSEINTYHKKTNLFDDSHHNE